MTAVQERPGTDDLQLATRRELLAAAQALVPELRATADQADRDRRLPEQTVAALRDGGFFKLTTPRRFGGHQANMRTYLEVTAELARGCSSSAWVTMILGGGNFSTSLYNEKAQNEVFGTNPDAAVAGVLTAGATGVRTAGGQVLTGKWGFASGSYQADWIVLVFNIIDDKGQPIDQGLALVPMSELTIEDTWFVAGMRGTGSNTVVAQDVFVPDHRILSLTALAQGRYATEFTDEAEYRTHALTALVLAIVGPQLGMAQAALERVLDIVAKGKPISYSFYQRSADSPSYQLNIADAASLIDKARLHALRAADDLDEAGRTGEIPGTLQRARIRMDIGQAAKHAREAVDLLLNVGGAGSFAEVNSLQRIWRDIETASRHASINTDLSRELYGRALLGIEEQVAPF
ncbi:acyl-CoA dehydrogenase family protein [Nocardia nova]|uniref:acyl-CoA dehydrogenase family protein n=1 Tax=Nocardia nova TaxID=37330 RepID=UPI0018951ECF|nr:acyl-CoA dehydrogenase family protein [Nocardia nova]MBF6148396.1 acyl-CoA dehydrogenase family protein [Nocardia nova]MDN2496295.1 oxidoreductase [Nocardia nova]